MHVTSQIPSHPYVYPTNSMHPFLTEMRAPVYTKVQTILYNAQWLIGSGQPANIVRFWYEDRRFGSPHRRWITSPLGGSILVVTLSLRIMHILVAIMKEVKENMWNNRLVAVLLCCIINNQNIVNQFFSDWEPITPFREAHRHSAIFLSWIARTHAPYNRMQLCRSHACVTWGGKWTFCRLSSV